MDDCAHLLRLTLFSGLFPQQALSESPMFLDMLVVGDPVHRCHNISPILLPFSCNISPLFTFADVLSHGCRGPCRSMPLTKSPLFDLPFSGTCYVSLQFTFDFHILPSLFRVSLHPRSRISNLIFVNLMRFLLIVLLFLKRKLIYIIFVHRE